MLMTFLIWLGILALSLTSLILPWVQRVQIRNLRTNVEILRKQTDWLLSFSDAPTAGPPLPEPAPEPGVSAWRSNPIYSPESTVSSSPDEIFVAGGISNPPADAMDTPLQRPQTGPDSALRAPSQDKPGFEQQMGARLPVWIGGVALAMAGFFMVKFSIENNLLSPAVRLWLGGFFGIGLLVTASWIRGKIIANGVRISQALSGAGIADLYICLFAANRLYDFIPGTLAFGGMAGVTALAVLLSLRHGPPIALMGLMGGFLTPALVSVNEPNAPLLFGYLYLVLAGLFVVIRRQQWWWLSIPAIIAVFLWVVAWIFGSGDSGDSLWPGLFLIAISATVVLQSRQAFNDGAVMAIPVMRPSAALNYLTLGGAVALQALVAVHSGLGIIEWGMFGLLAAGGIALAYLNPKIYGFVPWLSMAVTAAMLVSWDDATPSMFALTAGIFALLYCAAGSYALWRSPVALLWGGLTAATSLVYYLIAYYHLYTDVSAYQAENPDVWMAGWPVWGLAALLVSVLAIQMLQKIRLNFTGVAEDRERLLAVFAVLATSFVSIALSIELHRDFLPVAFAAQVLALGWINGKVDIQALRPIAGAVFCVFTALFIPQAIQLLEIAANSGIYFSSRTHWQLPVPDGTSIIRSPWFHLGLPGLLFAGASLLLRAQKDDNLVRCLEAAAVLLSGLMLYYLTRNVFKVEAFLAFDSAEFMWRSAITNILFLHGLASLWVGRHFHRRVVSMGGLLFAGIALCRILFFDLALYNPLWSHQMVGATVLLNGLLLPYGLPALWLIVAKRELRALGMDRFLPLTSAFTLILLFTFISLNVRQFFHGAYLSIGDTSNAEIYTYSVFWLLFGVALLILGALRRDRLTRMASLAVMLLTVGKVFLYDASELSGLYRVFSFLGLGLSLMALSWLYTRFVFGIRDNPGQEDIQHT